jgi:hypothetical protein
MGPCSVVRALINGGGTKPLSSPRVVSSLGLFHLFGRFIVSGISCFCFPCFMVCCSDVSVFTFVYWGLFAILFGGIVRSIYLHEVDQFRVRVSIRGRASKAS